MKRKFQKFYFVLKIFLLFFAALFIICTIIFLTIENNEIENKINEIKLNEEMFVKLRSEKIIDSFGRAALDLSYLRGDFDLLDKGWYSQWRFAMESNGVYSGIRFVDLDGDQVFGLNYYNKETMIDSNGNQNNIKEEDYFINTISLENEQIYISNVIIDENNESSKKVSVMFCTPIYSPDLVGIIILEYDAENMIQELSKHLDETKGEIYLVSDYGYWGSTSGQYRGIDTNYYDVSYSAGLLPAEKWEVLKETMHNLTDEGLFTIAEVNFSEKLNESENNQGGKIILQDSNYSIITFIESDEEYRYYFYNELTIKMGKILSEKYWFFIGCLFISAIIAFSLIINKSNFEKMKNSSHYDPLTKVYNRRRGFDILEEYVAQINYYKKICLCFIDINGLKEVNDSLGHSLGDELIVTVSDTIKNAIRQEDLIIRMGGDEFLIVLMKVEKPIAETIWSRIVESFKAVNSMENRNYVISVSHGIVEIRPSENKIDLSTLITEADDKMYKEKIRIKKSLTILRRKF